MNLSNIERPLKIQKKKTKKRIGEWTKTCTDHSKIHLKIIKRISTSLILKEIEINVEKMAIKILLSYFSLSHRWPKTQKLSDELHGQGVFFLMGVAGYILFFYNFTFILSMSLYFRCVFFL